MNTQTKLEKALSEAAFNTEAVNTQERDLLLIAEQYNLAKARLSQQKNLLEQSILEVKAYQAILLTGGNTNATE